MQSAIANQIGCSVASIQSMWNSQRGYFREKWQKYKAGKSKGLNQRDLDDIKRWKFWDILQFLVDDFKNDCGNNEDIFADEITISDGSIGDKSDDSDAEREKERVNVSAWHRTSRSPSTSDSGTYSARNNHAAVSSSVIGQDAMANCGTPPYNLLEQHNHTALLLATNAASGLNMLENEQEAFGAKYDSAFLFGMQVCNELRALTPEKRDLATVKITNLLYEIKYAKFAD